MRVLIIGAGEVGYQVTKFLALEGVDVVVLDREPEKLKRISDEIDVATIVADGCSPSGLTQAEAGKSDMLLAVTNSDETNMLACVLSRAMFNIPRKIARIRNPEYFKSEQILRDLDINPAINPELEVARAIVRLIETPFAVDVEDFEDGVIKVIGFNIPEDSMLVGKRLRDIGGAKKFLIGIIERQGRVIIPAGNDVISVGDVIYMPVKKWEIGDAMAFLGVSAKPARKVMISGGGRVGYYAASAIETKADVKIIEKDAERCKYLSKTLKKSTILHGDGSNRSLLIEENAGDMDVFVSVSNNEELNIMASVLAKRLGTKKTVTIVNRTEYLSLAHGLGLQAVLSPRLITASTILKYVRRGDILSLTAIAEDMAEIIEARIGGKSKLAGKMLKNAKLPKSTLIGAIMRQDRIIIPTGEDLVKEGDKLIIFTIRESIRDVEKLLA